MKYVRALPLGFHTAMKQIPAHKADPSRVIGHVGDKGAVRELAEGYALADKALMDLYGYGRDAERTKASSSALDGWLKGRGDIPSVSWLAAELAEKAGVSDEMSERAAMQTEAENESFATQPLYHYPFMREVAARENKMFP